MLCIVAVSTFFLARPPRSFTGGSWSTSNETGLVSALSDSPFTGAFARFPRISALQTRQRRITLISVWNDDGHSQFFRHFLHTIQLNADAVDLLFINRRMTEESQCLDFEEQGIDITWGGNIKYVCMDDKEWKRRYVDFLCSPQYGWDCNSTEHGAVTTEYQKRKDERNYEWRPFFGYVFRDLFQTPDNPFWAWIDTDILVGNFVHYPFNVLSGVSLLTGTESVPKLLMMAG